MRNTPGFEYIKCKVVGAGFRFVEAYKTNNGGTTPGVLVGTVVLKGNGLGRGVRTLDSDLTEPRNDEPIFDLKELPSDVEMMEVIDRMIRTHPLEAERMVIREWDYVNGKIRTIGTWLAPRGFVPPNEITEASMPENVPKKTERPEAKPLEVSLGEILATHKKQRQARTK